MDISIIGTGYVGLVSGVCLSEKGHNVVCVDNNVEKVAQINRGISPIHEDGLNELLKSNIGHRLKGSSDLNDAVMNSSVSLIAVGTPFDGNSIDLKYVQQASKEIGFVLKEKSEFHVVVVKSTVVPGTTDDVVIPMLEKYSEKKAGTDFGVSMNPEFLREGAAVDDFMNPDRIVLGGIDDMTHNVMKELYQVFRNVDILLTSNKTAEMIKYTSNSLLATLISFSNEIGNLCSDIGDIDALEVMKGVHLDKRISPIIENGQRVSPGIVNYLEAGCGFGGSCFPKDVKALISYGIQLGSEMKLLQSVIGINKKQPSKILELIHKHFDSLVDIKVAVMGLAFKPKTDDMRESPSISIIKSLLQKNTNIYAYDPIAQHKAEIIFAGESIRYCKTIYNTIKDAEIIIILTGWPEFDEIPEIIENNTFVNPPLVVDGRRFLSKNSVIKYEGIGLS
jgi:UDPglucose 6-dehydrogenase